MKRKYNPIDSEFYRKLRKAGHTHTHTHLRTNKSKCTRYFTVMPGQAIDWTKYYFIEWLRMNDSESGMWWCEMKMREIFADTACGWRIRVA